MLTGMKVQAITKNESIQTPVRQKLVNEKAFRTAAAATQQPHEVFVFDAANDVHLVVEVLRPVLVVEEEPLDSNLSSIRKDSLEQRTASDC